MNKKQRKYKTRDGSSLLIALGITSVLVLVSLGVMTIVVSSIRESTNVTGANMAYYTAEGMLEEGLLANQSHGAGYSDEGTQGGSACTTHPGTNCGSYTIVGQVPENYGYPNIGYGIPAPGTGSAGVGCNPLNPVYKDAWYYDSIHNLYYYGADAPTSNDYSRYEAIDHPCNWNKIKIGDNVSIPLYVTTYDSTSNCPVVDSASGLRICNPADMRLNSITIKVRTPCSNGKSMCANSERYQFCCFDLNTPAQYMKTNPTVMSWQITASNKNGDKFYTLLPNTTTYLNILNCKDDSGNRGRCENKSINNSEIYESQINTGMSSDYIVVKPSDSGIDQNNNSGLISDYLLNGLSFEGSLDNEINKPVLKLSIIHSLQSQDTSIPYLEYQVLTNAATIPPTDSSQTITAQGFSGTFKQVLEVKQPQGSGLLEYVIQQ